MKTISLFSLLIFISISAAAQSAFSIATDLNLLRSFTKGEGFTSIGQTVHYQLHFTKRETAYAWFSYHTTGKFKNDGFVRAKDLFTTPQKLDYKVSSAITFHQFSLGWKHYFKGGYEEEKTWSLYGIAGFGMLSGKVENAFNKEVDTLLFYPAQLPKGSGKFNRLTIDLGLGGEQLLGPGIYLYGELRTWLPASDYPSAYLYNNDIPRVLLLNIGVRILID